MATGKKLRSTNCRHVPEASELNGENGCCLERLSRSAGADSLAWEYQSPAGLWAIGCSATRGAALVRVGVGVGCERRVTEHSQRSRCPVDGSWPRRPVTPDQPVAQQAQRRAGEEEDLHSSDGREEKLETSRGDGKQQRIVR